MKRHFENSGSDYSLVLQSDYLVLWNPETSAQ